MYIYTVSRGGGGHHVYIYTVSRGGGGIMYIYIYIYIYSQWGGASCIYIQSVGGGDRYVASSKVSWTRYIRGIVEIYMYSNFPYYKYHNIYLVCLLKIKT